MDWTDLDLAKDTETMERVSSASSASSAKDTETMEQLSSASSSLTAVRTLIDTTKRKRRPRPRIIHRHTVIVERLHRTPTSSIDLYGIFLFFLFTFAWLSLLSYQLFFEQADGLMRSSPAVVESLIFMGPPLMEPCAPCPIENITCEYPSIWQKIRFNASARAHSLSETMKHTYHAMIETVRDFLVQGKDNVEAVLQSCWNGSKNVLQMGLDAHSSFWRRVRWERNQVMRSLFSFPLYRINGH